MNNWEYYIVELVEDVINPFNEEIYNKGVRVIVWEDKNLDCFWVCNLQDNFKTNCAKKIYKLNIEEVTES